MNEEHPMSGACYRCAHRRSLLPDSAHSACHHPAVAPLHAQPSMQFAGLAGRRGGDGMIANVQLAAAQIARQLNVAGHERGVRGNFFIWPVNFDPTWLESCDGFTAKDEVIRERLVTYGGGAD